MGIREKSGNHLAFLKMESRTTDTDFLVGISVMWVLLWCKCLLVISVEALFSLS